MIGSHEDDGEVCMVNAGTHYELSEGQSREESESHVFCMNLG